MGLRILVGLIGIPLGFLILIYRDKIKNWTGDFAWAERYLGSGGTWTALILVGILTGVLSFMFMVGSLQELILKSFGDIL